mmetsp:Transcript_63686/g.201403  ORF Transcript_63686/g.201403 Transcript_63686/m.201403 type:complete len:149 (+) Transcript_63686:180-626(+)
MDRRACKDELRDCCGHKRRRVLFAPPAPGEIDDFFCAIGDQNAKACKEFEARWGFDVVKERPTSSERWEWTPVQRVQLNSGEECASGAAPDGGASVVGEGDEARHARARRRTSLSQDVSICWPRSDSSALFFARPCSPTLQVQNTITC